MEIEGDRFKLYREVNYEVSFVDSYLLTWVAHSDRTILLECICFSIIFLVIHPSVTSQFLTNNNMPLVNFTRLLCR